MLIGTIVWLEITCPSIMDIFETNSRPRDVHITQPHIIDKTSTATPPHNQTLKLASNRPANRRRLATHLRSLKRRERSRSRSSRRIEAWNWLRRTSTIDRHRSYTHGNVVCNLCAIPDMLFRLGIIEIAHIELLAILSQLSLRNLDLEAKSQAIVEISALFYKDFFWIHDVFDFFDVVVAGCSCGFGHVEFEVADVDVVDVKADWVLDGDYAAGLGE